jgi:hypothetical protein
LSRNGNVETGKQICVVPGYSCEKDLVPASLLSFPERGFFWFQPLSVSPLKAKTVAISL